MKRQYWFYRIGDGNCLIGGGNYETDSEAVEQGLDYADMHSKTLAKIVRDEVGGGYVVVWTLRDGLLGTEGGRP